MKTKIFIIVIVLLLMAFQSNAIAVQIIDVNVVPDLPSMLDVITLHIRGWAPQSGSWVAYEEYSQDGTSLQLDLHIDMGWSGSLSYWSYSKAIGTLRPGTYLLTVRGFNPNGFPSNEPCVYTKQFTVTPEPATIIFLVAGVPIFRKLTRRKIINR